MKRELAALGAAAGMALLSGCSAGDPTVEPVPSDAAEPVESTEDQTADEPEPEVSSESPEPTEEESDAYGGSEETSHGFLLKEVDQLAGLGMTEDDESIIDFTLTEMVPDFECTSEYAEPPERGMYLGLKFDIRTHADLAEESPPEFFMTMHDFRVWDADGSRVNDPTTNGSCLASDDWIPTPLGPGESASGWIVLDVPSDISSFAFSPYPEVGWEWIYEG